MADEWDPTTAMKEYHTGHLPKPQLVTLTGRLEPEAVPQRASFGVMESKGPERQTAFLWLPPKMKYRQEYSKVEHYYSDLNKITPSHHSQ